MNLFARGLGGVFSDSLNESMGMRGRLIVQTVLLLGEGAAVFIFASTDSLAGAIIVLVLFSLFVQSAEGTTYAIVPYVDPINMGTVTGVVGAGGNVGAVAFGLCFRELDYKTAFNIMGSCIMVSSIVTVFINIPGYSRLQGGEDLVVDKETGEILEFDGEDSVMDSSRRGQKEPLV